MIIIRDIYEIFIHYIENFPGRTGRMIRRIIYRFLFKKFGKKVNINENVKIHGKSKFEIGDNTGVNYGTWITASGGLRIGNDVLIGPYVIIHTMNHNYQDKSKLIRNQGSDIKPVIIEDNVWIAARSIILPGVEIGKGSVIGAGSVVTRSIPPFSVVVGNPAKLIK